MMKYFFSICITVLLFTNNVFAQEKPITHKVEKGETIIQIAMKYKVTPFDIYQLNPDVQNGLKPNSVLLIPNKSSSKISITPAKTNVQSLTHLVTPKETLYGIEKKYGVSDEDLKRANPFIEKEGLQIGQTLVIPLKNKAINTALVQDKVIYHDVLPKETKYSISRKYGITIAELEKRNPEIVSGLPIGYRLIIKGSLAQPAEDHVQFESEKKNSIQKLMEASTGVTYIAYEVQPKETLYSLSKTFGMSQEGFIALNPELNNGVEIGMVLKVPSQAANPQEDRKEYAALSKKISFGNRKKMVLLLPFNIARVEADTINSIATRLTNDKFLNMTLDFYAGALMAIDSAKVLGLPIDVEIYDSEETKNSSNVAAIIKANNIESANAIIGPFYQSNAETVAQLLNEQNVPVISPLSKDVGNPFNNLYQTILVK
jgi:LysM repeat protein